MSLYLLTFRACTTQCMASSDCLWEPKSRKISWAICWGKWLITFPVWASCSEGWNKTGHISVLHTFVDITDRRRRSNLKSCKRRTLQWAKFFIVWNHEEHCTIIHAQMNYSQHGFEMSKHNFALHFTCPYRYTGLPSVYHAALFFPPTKCWLLNQPYSSSCFHLF